MSFSVCYAVSFVLSLFNLCLQFCVAVVFLLLFVFLIHVSMVLCHKCLHLVFVFVFKYPWRGWMYIHFDRCADSCTDADWRVRTIIHTCMQIEGMILWMPTPSLAGTLKQKRDFVRVLYAGIDVWWLFVCCTHTCTSLCTSLHCGGSDVAHSYG